MLKHRPSLKPCPFCGCMPGWVHIVVPHSYDMPSAYRIICEQHSHSVSVYGATEQQAAERWNFRPNDEHMVVSPATERSAAESRRDGEEAYRAGNYGARKVGENNT